MTDPKEGEGMKNLKVTIFLLILLTLCAEGFANRLFLLHTHSTPEEVVNAVVFYGEDVNAQNAYGYTPLYQYASLNMGNPEVIRALIEAVAAVDYRDGGGKTPLMVAAGRNWYSEGIQILIDEGADVNATDQNGSSPLMFAAMNNRGNQSDAAIVKALIDSGADVQMQTRTASMTALMSAAGSGLPIVVKALLEAGANVNALNHNGMTALLCAAQITHFPEIITLLLEFGSDPYVEDKRGKNAYDYAKNNPNLRGSPVLDELH